MQVILFKNKMYWGRQLLVFVYNLSHCGQWSILVYTVTHMVTQSCRYVAYFLIVQCLSGVLHVTPLCLDMNTEYEHTDNIFSSGEPQVKSGIKLVYASMGHCMYYFVLCITSCFLIKMQVCKTALYNNFCPNICPCVFLFLQCIMVNYTTLLVSIHLFHITY